MTFKKNHIWLRCETKKFERRTPLTPSNAKVLVEKKHPIHVESSQSRIFKDEQYREAGCRIETPGSWPTAPLNAYILGLKELPEETIPIKHRHIYFAHVYKKQAGAAALLKRFKNGQGVIFDLEYLHDENGGRVVTFGKWAGFIGAGLSLDIFCQHPSDRALGPCSAGGAMGRSRPGEEHPGITHSFNSTQLIDRLSEKLSLLKNAPRIIIIGAQGRTGQGAIELLHSLNLEATEWDLQETKDGGPFKEIVDYNILINCVLVKEKIPPFLTFKTLEVPTRRLSVIADIACDPGSPFNPLPIYDHTTTFEHPTHRLISGPDPLDVMAIDHLPSLLPAESSIDFSGQLLPYLTALLESEEMPRIWRNAKTYYDRTKQSPY